jgi:hypothetical protein
MHGPKGLLLHAFGGGDPLALLPSTHQVTYLRGYLADLGATSVLEEPQYFDRDYLSEFAAFYSVSSAGYANVCRRLHFFSGPAVTRAALEAAVSGPPEGAVALQTNYLGFVVLRPIPQAPLGRTVLSWYRDPSPMTPRVVNPSRRYVAHVAGVELSVVGLAWQQQDTGVGACATVGLWSMMHSSAFDDSHAIPTTAEITRAAHDRSPWGARVFPSKGLNIFQVAEAIKAWNLSPLMIEGNLRITTATGVPEAAFDPGRFSATCAAFIRSRYPLLIIGTLGGLGGHAVCAVGFRSSGNPSITPNTIEIQDSWITQIYAHDDNIGPNVRFKISRGPNKEALLELDSPPPTDVRKALGLPNVPYDRFVPHRIVVAVHNDLRTSVDAVHKAALNMGNSVGNAANALLTSKGEPMHGTTASARFIRLADYLGLELHNLLNGTPTVLANARLALLEHVRPMSLHLGVVRIGDDQSAPLMDILYDTTDSDRNHPVFANVAYSDLARQAEKVVSGTAGAKVDFGVAIDAF